MLTWYFYSIFVLPKIRFMIPNVDNINSNVDVLNDLNNEADQYSFLLSLKEISFLVIILFFGFSGFSFCVNKIYSPKSVDKIDDVIIHDMDLVDVNVNATPKISLQTVLK